MQSKAQITSEQMAAIPAIVTTEIAENKRPLVSIIMLTYNHELYIREAVTSIIEQKTDFGFELLIGEDASTDNTLSLCKELQKENPQIIKLVTSEENVGMHQNFARLWHRAKGNYVAFCEGDDYWADKNKIGKQVDFLVKNLNCSLCGTYTQSIKKDENGDWHPLGTIKPDTIQQSYSFSELISRYNFHFSSVMVHREKVHFPIWFWDVYCVDRPLYLLAAQEGDAGLLPDVTSVYRHHAGGSWSPLNLMEKSRRSIFLFKHMRDYFPAEYASVFEETLGNILFSYTTKAANSGQIAVARKIFRKSLQFRKIKTFMDFRVTASIAFRLYVRFL